ncbi:hypothetical protein OG760_20990 [Streptomyces sp. NBC_00963]|uniref:hypothetical protein n=1 Tax=Streptomyces sp. NBC_00963 TaxID=2903697 RepID=UPI003868B485|nr:hypothetical protein OG760_20990 [Streptomyces sp. NBC_00963]
MRERYAGAPAATTPHTVRVGVRRVAHLRTAFALLALGLALLVPVGPAVAQGSRPASQAAHLADLLRKDPVYVTDQLPRVVPRSTAPEFVKAAKATGVPTYVLVLPDQHSPEGSLLDAVHDRLGRDGLYVLVDGMGVAAATAYGVRAPADAASTVSLYELPYDAGPLLHFQRFTEVVAEGNARAAQRAEQARKTYSGEDGSDREPAPMYIEPTDRDNQSFLTGILLTGVPLLILLLSPYVRRRLRRRGQPATVVGELPKRSGPRSGPSVGFASGRHRWIPRLVEAACALLAAVAVVLVTQHTFDQKTSSAAPPPTAADMTSRIDRVAGGLKQDPLYGDPESPQPLDATQQAELRRRMAEFRESTGAVYLAVVPQLTDDEFGDEAGAFSAAVHEKVGKDGVYIVADPLEGDISVENYGLPLDDSRLDFGLPDAIRSDHEDSEPADFRLGTRLDQLMTYLDKAPQASQPGDSGQGAEQAPEPVEDNTLHPLFFHSDFWPGLVIGVLTALVTFGIVAALIRVGGALISLRTKHRVSGAPTATPVSFEAPSDPSASYLRRTARAEIASLGEEFDRQPQSLPGAVRIRVWDCLDAATLLMDHGPDGRFDEDTTAPELAAAIVLARSGRAAFASGTVIDTCCVFNPMHGAATRTHEVRSTERGRLKRRRIPVCAPCGLAAMKGQTTTESLQLTLPGAAHEARLGYTEVVGPLSSAQRGISQLLDSVREYAGVR